MALLPIYASRLIFNRKLPKGYESHEKPSSRPRNIVILFAVGGSCLNVSSSGGSSANETICEISARFLTWKVPVRLMTMGIILTSAFREP